MLALLFIFLNWHSHAEYRAFELNIFNAKTGKQRIVIKTVDQYQYRDYYAVAPDEEIKLVQSWMCWGHTGHLRPPCAKTDTLAASPQPSQTLVSPQKP